MFDGLMFWAFAGLSVLAALGVVFHRSIIYSALLLIVVFLSIAGIFILNNADFLAIAQTIVYAVGLTIILLFGVMFTGDRAFRGDVPKGQLLAFGIISALTLALLVKAVAFPLFPTVDLRQAALQNPYAAKILDDYRKKGTSEMLGGALFGRKPTSDEAQVLNASTEGMGPDEVEMLGRLQRMLPLNYALPFELASVLLLLAMMGAIVLAKKRFTLAEETFGMTTLPVNLDSIPRGLPVGGAQGGRPEEVSLSETVLAEGAEGRMDESGEKPPEPVGV